MPLTPTFQSAFQSAYRSGFTHNAGVFNSKRLDLSTNHDSSDTTISDRSPYGNDATLKSGVYFSTNGLTDKGINADCSAAGSGTYKLTGKVRSSSTGTKYVTMDGATADTLTVNTADVWQDFESSTFTGTPSNVVCGWDGGSSFSACDWSNVQLIDTSDGSTVSHFQGNESGAGDLDGKLVVDSSSNGYNGQHIGCAGGSAEPDILQTAGQNANRRMWFDGVDDDINCGDLGKTSGSYTSTYVKLKFLCNSPAIRFLFAKGGSGGGLEEIQAHTTTNRGIRFIPKGNLFYDTADFVWETNTVNEVEFSWSTTSGATCFINGVSCSLTKSGGIETTAGTYTATDFKIGRRLTQFPFLGVIYDLEVGEISASLIASYKGYGNTNADWEDQIGSNDGTVNGSPDNHYIPQSDSDNSIDAVGAAIANPRPNNKVINLIADDAKATVAADASMDVTKTIEGWVYYDGTDQTFLDIGTPVILAVSGYLSSSLAGIRTYYVNGAATTTLGSAGWKYIVVTSDTAQATDAVDILATSAAWKFIDRTLTVTEVLSRFNATKSQYGL